MRKSLAINGTRLNQVRLLKQVNAMDQGSLRYPLSSFRFLEQGGDFVIMSLPAYLCVELYRTGILPQDARIPVEVAVGDRSAGWYVVTEVSYPAGMPNFDGQVLFCLTRVSQPGARDTGAPPPARAEAADSPTSLTTDITHYLDESGEVARMPGPARQLASFLTLLIEFATADPAARGRSSGIRCRVEGCRGIIRASVTHSGNEIAWACPICGHSGFITNWQDTRWNQGKQSHGHG
jgi:hypothetical protein